eukprot:TRINITY_DN24918_c0_g1_i1.p1 TRINITY_DN24918_c0_g1~~TRINITY_DN24918_c0_g1_i1.p1  ORF type:complete len:626 (+),score=200.19 TRINITY_DN24918_c0_g1_i1:79-1956(+)
MNDVTYTYTLNAKETGRSTAGFGRHEPQALLYDARPDPEVKAGFIRSDLTETVVENMSTVRTCSTNTKHVPSETTSMLHLEGGWPSTVAVNESEARWKYVEKFERNEGYVAALLNTSPAVVAALRENNTLDFYERYSFPQESRAPLANLTPDMPALKIHSVFTSGDNGQIVDIAWSPAGRVAIASTRESKIWDVESPVAPAAYLNPAGLASYVSCLAFSSKDVNVVAGGSSAGVVQWWDKRQGDMPVQSTPPAISHNHEVLSIKWSSSKSGEAVTCSLDGRVKVWDMRQLSVPLENNTLWLNVPDEKGAPGAMRTLGGTVLDYTPLVGSSKFLVGTQEGYFLGCTRADGKEPSVAKAYEAHYGPVYSLSRCPSHPEFILSAGDWRCLLWREDQATPIWTTPYCETGISAATWHPTHSGLFCALRMDGCIEVWAFADKDPAAPALVAKLSKNPLCSLSIHSDGRYLAVGDTAGNLYIASFQGFAQEAYGGVDAWAEGYKHRGRDPPQSPARSPPPPADILPDPESPKVGTPEPWQESPADEAEFRKRYELRVAAARRQYRAQTLFSDDATHTATSPAWTACVASNVPDSPAANTPRGPISPLVNRLTAVRPSSPCDKSVLRLSGRT